VTLAVKDMDASVRFYQEVVRLPLNKRFFSRPGVELAFLGNSDGTEVELISGMTDVNENVGTGVSLGFEAESLEDTIALIREKGYETDGKIISPAPDISFFYGKDPDGYSIQFAVHKFGE
jgi:lactoylglutathione lyase